MSSKYVRNPIVALKGTEALDTEYNLDVPQEYDPFQRLIMVEIASGANVTLYVIGNATAPDGTAVQIVHTEQTFTTPGTYTYVINGPVPAIRVKKTLGGTGNLAKVILVS